VGKEKRGREKKAGEEQQKKKGLGEMVQKQLLSVAMCTLIEWWLQRKR